jgi:excisionase family DNA binding protein
MVPPSLELLPDKTALLTVKEASGWLRVSSSMLYDLIHSRRLETIKIGRRRLVPADALAALITELREEMLYGG